MKNQYLISDLTEKEIIYLLPLEKINKILCNE
jgi:hypothetical protein